MSTNYENGKIYKIVSPNTKLVYYGSTVQELTVRFSDHKTKIQCTSKQIIAFGGAFIELIKNFPCSCVEDLEDEEACYIRDDWSGCVNENVPGAIRRAGGIQSYKKQYNQQYYSNNTDKIKQYCKENSVKIAEQKKQYNEKNAVKIYEEHKRYQKENAVKIAEQQKRYNKENAVKISEQQKQYRKDNAEKLAQKRKQYRKDNAGKLEQKHECVICGGKYTTSGKSSHFKTKKHFKAVETQQSAKTIINIQHVEHLTVNK